MAYYGPCRTVSETRIVGTDGGIADDREHAIDEEAGADQGLVPSRLDSEMRRRGAEDVRALVQVVRRIHEVGAAFCGGVMVADAVEGVIVAVGDRVGRGAAAARHCAAAKRVVRVGE